MTRTKRLLQCTAVLLGTILLAYLVERAGPGKLLSNAKAVGWGMVLILALSGVSHILKTWAWRLAMRHESRKVSFSRTLGLRLVSEAIAQLGFVGQVLGDGIRISLVGSGIPVASSLSSVTLDRGLFIATGAAVTVTGILAAIVVLSFSGPLRFYAAVFVLVLVGLLVCAAVAVLKGWRLFSPIARAAGRVSWLREWLKSKESIIENADQQLLNFHRQEPGAFWGCLLLNVCCHALAIAEVYFILHFLGVHMSLLGALILEALTKLLNIVGAVNPGNVGSYEAGNMVFGKLLGLTTTEGLTLGLCRRFRGIFWAIIGSLCLLWFYKSRHSASQAESTECELGTKQLPEEHASGQASQSHSHVAIILAVHAYASAEFQPCLACVGTLPVLLRAILAAQSSHADRILVVVDAGSGPRVRRQVCGTGRVPETVEWVEVAGAAALPSVIRHAAYNAQRVSLTMADRTYHPSLQRRLAEWDGTELAVEFASAGGPVGLFALSHELAVIAEGACELNAITAEGLHSWIAGQALLAGSAFVDPGLVPEAMWQPIATQQDCVRAEEKLNTWLVKPTDGIFARMNRRVSIPMSRQIIKFPITPNMVSLFTLLVSIAAGVYFALGGYWNTLFGAVLSVWASILDGCDGEVARLKLQATDFGCWLETICDYLYYLFIFAGMAIGLARSTGKGAFLGWGAALLFGAVLTFLVAGFGRQRLSGKYPEQYLAVWQKHAEGRASNPILYLGRRLEFILRRCFLPYALLAFALLNLTMVPLCVGAVGANIAWIVSLYSHCAFSRKLHDGNVVATHPTAVTTPLIA